MRNCIANIRELGEFFLSCIHAFDGAVARLMGNGNQVGYGGFGLRFQIQIQISMYVYVCVCVGHRE